MMRKTVYFTALFLMVSLVVSANDDEKGSKEDSEINTSEPVTYVVGIIKQGENWRQDSLRATELQEQHLAFLQTLIANNKLIASGPLTSSSDVRGLYVFKVKTVKEAMALMANDDAMNTGWISMDYHVWKSRDYSVSEPVTIESESKSLIGIRGVSIAFVVVISIFVIRTFRYKANV